MSIIFHESCPICGEKNLTEFIKAKDYSISKEAFEMYKCGSCGFILTQNVPNQEHIGIYYKSDVYISHSDTSKGFINKVYHTVRAIMLDKKAKLVEQISGIKAGKLLDIGTGLGYFPNHIRSRGWQVWGIEQDEETRNLAIKNFDLKIDAPAELYKMENREFDVISLWHVLEHVHDLSGYMNVIKSNLKDEGTLVVALPNAASPDAKYYGKYWAAYDLPRHLWHWNPSTFGKFANNNGFHIIEKKPMPLDSFYVSLLSEKYKGSNFSLIEGFIHGFITWIKSLNNSDLSSSVIYFLRKN